MRPRDELVIEYSRVWRAPWIYLLCMFHGWSGRACAHTLDSRDQALLARPAQHAAIIAAQQQAQLLALHFDHVNGLLQA